VPGFGPSARFASILRRSGVTRYQPQSDTVMRMHAHAQTAMIENGFVHLPKEAAWLPEYLHG
jgi:phage terminase large subunit-like protein